MTARDRRARAQQETRDKILGAARDMFAEEGYDAVTMRSIAARIEYTPTAIYHHFKNKNALLTELCMRDFESLALHFNASVGAADPLHRILAVGEAYLRFAEERPSQYRFMFMTVLPEPDLDEEYVRSRRGDPEKDAYAFLRDACREAIESGLLRPEVADADEMAQMLWGAVHGMIAIRVAKRHASWIPWRELRTTALRGMRVMLRGLLRDPARFDQDLSFFAHPHNTVRRTTDVP